MPTRQEAVAKFLQANPKIVPFDNDEPMRAYGTTPEEGSASGVKVPYYCAGFFIHSTWVSTYFQKNKVIGGRMDFHIRKLPGGNALDASLRVTPYLDETGCEFLCMHDNIADSDDWSRQNERWLARRNEQLDILCILMKLKKEEIEMVKKNFAWYIFRPRVYKRVPYEMTLHDPSLINEYHK